MRKNITGPSEIRNLKNHKQDINQNDANIREKESWILITKRTERERMQLQITERDDISSLFGIFCPQSETFPLEQHNQSGEKENSTRFRIISRSRRQTKNPRTTRS